MTITRAFRDGITRVNNAPAVLAGVALLTLAMAVPLAAVLRGQISGHLGSSLEADRAAEGVNYHWWLEFLDQAQAPGSTFTPSVIGFAAPLRNLSALVDNQPQATLICGVGTAYAVVWLFLLGGVIDRLARHRRTQAHGFFAASGTFFFRFLRLGFVSWLVLLFLFGPLHRWLFQDFYPWWTRDFTVERSAFMVRLVLYVVFAALTAAVVAIFDYAKVRAVVEDRRSALGALAAGFRFVRHRPGRVAGLFLLNALVLLIVMALYAIVAPGAGGAGASAWVALVIGQLYLLARLWTKLLFYASEVAFFQGELAHVAYTAAPPMVWPESPAAEAIVNAGLDGERA